MRIATWNVNSLRIRLPHLLDWLASQQPDVMCLQETKTEDRDFPLAEIQATFVHISRPVVGEHAVTNISME